MQLHPARVGLAAAACALASAVAPAAVFPQLTDPYPLPGDLALGASAGEQQLPWIARGADGYLVVWEDARSSLTGTVDPPNGFHPNSDIYAVRLDANGAVQDTAPIAVAQSTFNQDMPRVAWNGESWLVVWRSTRLADIWYTDGIYGARVSAAGELLDDPPIVIDDADGVDEYRPVVASSGSEWVVLWQDYPGGAVNVIDGARVSAEGVVVDKHRVVTPPTQFELPTNYELVFARDRFLFGYERGYSGGIAFRFLDPLMNQMGAPINVAAGVKPRTASNGASFYLHWQGSGIRGTPIAQDGTIAVPGGVELSSGTPVGSTGTGVTWDGARWVSVWGNGFSVSAAQVSTGGALLPGSPFAILPDADYAIDPVVGGGGALAIAAWTDGRSDSISIGFPFDIYGATIQSGPTVSAEYPLSVSAPAQTVPDLAGERVAGYLAVFVSETSEELRVMAQRLDGLGAPVDSEPLELAAGPRVRHPRVAWNGEVWCVVWEEYGLGIFAQRIGTDGAPLDPAPISMLPGNEPDVAALGTMFLAVSTHEPMDHIRSVRGRRLDGTDGSLPDGSFFTIGGSYSLAPAVEGLADRWIVSWQRHPTHDSPYSTIKGAFVTEGGTPQAEFFLENASGAQQQTPRIALGDTIALVAWADRENQELRARLVRRDGTLLGTDQGIVLTGAPGMQFQPNVGWSGEEFLVGYTDHRSNLGVEPGLGDVYATRVRDDGTVLDFPSGFALGAHFALVEGNASVAGGSGRFVTGHAALSLEHGALRIALRQLIGTSVGDRYCFGDGEGTHCPCGNESLDGGGCANGTGVGALLSGAGSASITASDLVLDATHLSPGQPALLFAGTNALGGGDGIAFGDGLRCAGGGVVRLGVRTAASDGSASWGPGLAGGWSAGDTAYFQAWYRDPASSPCGGGFNLSNGVAVLFEP